MGSALLFTQSYESLLWSRASTGMEKCLSLMRVWDKLIIYTGDSLYLSYHGCWPCRYADRNINPKFLQCTVWNVRLCIPRVKVWAVWNVQDNPGFCLPRVYNDPGLKISQVKRPVCLFSVLDSGMMPLSTVEQIKLDFYTLIYHYWKTNHVQLKAPPKPVFLQAHCSEKYKLFLYKLLYCTWPLYHKH